MTSVETRQVLEMLSQGKVSVQEAEQLLQAVAGGANAEQKPVEPKYFRILVTKPATDRRKAENVNIRVPISVVRGGLRLSALFPGILGKKTIHLHNGAELDLSNVTYADLEAMIKDIGQLSVDVDDDGGKRVTIRCE
jgi:hypothetical protein